MQQPRMPELDGIRGIACLMVLLDHVVVSGLPWDRIPGMYRLSQWLIGGVDLFFVLSGFLIGGILIDNKDAANYFKVFWVRRAGRIMPVYYLLMASFFVMILIKPYLNAPWLDAFLFKNPMALWTYPLFVQNFAQAIDGGDGGARWVASTWSLAIEEQFYLVLPPLIYVMSRRSIAAFGAACVAAALLVRGALWHTTGSWFTGYFLLPGRMDSLAFGLLAALAIRNENVMTVLKRFRWGLDAAAIGVVIFLTGKNLESIGAQLPAAASFVVLSLDFTLRAALFAYAIVRVFLSDESSWYRRALASAPLVFTGTISYALYMYHPAVNGMLHGLIFGDEPRVNDRDHLLVAIVVMALSGVLGWLSTRYFERPFRRLSHRVSYRRAAGGVQLGRNAA